jgi:hypothetical protein
MDIDSRLPKKQEQIKTVVPVFILNLFFRLSGCEEAQRHEWMLL